MILTVTKQPFSGAIFKADCCYMVMESKDDAKKFYNRSRGGDFCAKCAWPVIGFLEVE